MVPDRPPPLRALVLPVLLAGCSAAGSLTMDPVTDAELVDRASRSFDPSGHGSGDDPEAHPLRSAAENGSATNERP